MASTQKKILEYLRTIDTEYKDNRVLSQLEHRCLVWYFLYLQNVLSQFGLEYKGSVFRQGEAQCLLVTKAYRGATQLVAYTSGRTTIDCVRIFVRKWHDDSLEWFPDRYP